jgi:hypothetical protein
MTKTSIMVIGIIRRLINVIERFNESVGPSYLTNFRNAFEREQCN